MVGATPTSRRRGGVSRDWRLALAVVIGSAAVRLVIAGTTPLFPDETYYWEWSRHLAFGYYDHPPMVAWTIRAGTAIAGATALGVRLGAVIAGGIASFLLVLAARRIAHSDLRDDTVSAIDADRAALVTAIVFAAMPLAAAGLILATPDAPLFAAAAGTMYALVRVFEHAPRTRASTIWWCVAGLTLGLAFASKITAALIPFAILVALLTRARLRPRLAEPGPYLGIAIALLLFLPVVLWNARHGWISFAFQLQHGLGGASGSVLRRELDLLGGQAGLVSPVLFVMIVVAVVVAMRADKVRAFLAVVAAVLFGFFVYSASRRRVEANWPALAYLPATLLVVTHSASRRWLNWLKGGVALALIVTVVTYINAFTPVLPVPARRDPAARASGWDKLAAIVDAERRSESAAPVHVAADRYQEASALAWHLADHPETFALNLSSRANQYDLWPGFPDRAVRGTTMLLVLDDLAGTPTTITLLAPHFTTVTRGPLAALARDGDLVKNLRVWRLSGWRGTWPQARLRSRT